MSQSITFEPLPPARTGTGQLGHHDRIASELRSRTGEWAHVITLQTVGSACSMAFHIRTGKLKAYQPAGSYEAHARTVAGERRVYARYVGEPNE